MGLLREERMVFDKRRKEKKKKKKTEKYKKKSAFGRHLISECLLILVLIPQTIYRINELVKIT